MIISYFFRTLYIYLTFLNFYSQFSQIYIFQSAGCNILKTTLPNFMIFSTFVHNEICDLSDLLFENLVVKFPRKKLCARTIKKLCARVSVQETLSTHKSLCARKNSYVAKARAQIKYYARIK